MDDKEEKKQEIFDRAAKNAWKMFMAYRNTGFTLDQALELTKITVREAVEGNI